ncbi:lysozyme-like [Diadema antillarum]|uniref:lysozyme-like n=1 Tax=Diadema antillarum TaxID=105358 RepID=UPI003A853943
MENCHFWCFYGSLEKEREAINANEPLVPEKCLQCICEVETECNPPFPRCQSTYKNLPCGPMGVNFHQWKLAHESGEDVGSSFETCASDVECSKRVVHAYVGRFQPPPGKGSGINAKCQFYSRLFKGGPNGPQMPQTVSYWARISQCLNRPGDD